MLSKVAKKGQGEFTEKNKKVKKLVPFF